MRSAAVLLACRAAGLAPSTRRHYLALLGGAAPAAGGSCSDDVFSIFNGPQGQDPNGVNIADVVAALNGRFTDAQVREAVESLVNDGHLYSTIDDAHFRSTLL